MNNIQSLSLFLPELVLVGTILFAILFDLVKTEKDHNVGNLVLAGLLLSLAAIWLTRDQGMTSLFMGTLVLDSFSIFFKSLVTIATLFIILVSRENDELKGYQVGEYYILITALTFGIYLMVSSIDLIMVYLSIEVVSISSFILAGYLKNSQRSNESSLKYVIYGAFSSGLMLFGLSILFGLTGSTNFTTIQTELANLSETANFALIIASALILAGFGYKISAVPFHFWTPDVYEGAPTPVTAYLSVAPKAAGFALLIRFFHSIYTDGNMLIPGEGLGGSGLPWPQLIAVLAVITMTLGNLVALQQTNVKRMLAYSSIAHAGYMLMALPMLSIEGVYSILIYLVMYTMMNLGAFVVVMVVRNQTGGEQLDDYTGLGWKMPFAGAVMTIFMLSLTGIPPTAGFIAKFYLFAAVIKAGPSFYWLAFAGAVNSVISLYYYMRVIKAMFLKGEPQAELIPPSRLMSVLLTVFALGVIFFGVYWAPIADWVRNSLIFFTQIQ